HDVGAEEASITHDAARRDKTAARNQEGIHGDETREEEVVAIGRTASWDSAEIGSEVAPARTQAVTPLGGERGADVVHVEAGRGAAEPGRTHSLSRRGGRVHRARGCVAADVAGRRAGVLRRASRAPVLSRA